MQNIRENKTGGEVICRELKKNLLAKGKLKLGASE
jgi:hypothetical protein